jgi:hypothetical protein
MLQELATWVTYQPKVLELVVIRQLLPWLNVTQREDAHADLHSATQHCSM